MITYTVQIYYSKHGTSDVEHLEMSDNYCYSKEIPGQKKPILPIPPPRKAR